MEPRAQHLGFVKDVAIVSPGRTASTTLMDLVVQSRRRMGIPCESIWEFTPVYKLMNWHFLMPTVVKGESTHYLPYLKNKYNWDVIFIKRENQFEQVLSHLVSHYNGQYHSRTAVSPKLNVNKHDFLMGVHLILGVEECWKNVDKNQWASVHEWTFEEMIKDPLEHLKRISINNIFDGEFDGLAKRGVKWDTETFENWSEINDWAQEAKEQYGFRYVAY